MSLTIRDLSPAWGAKHYSERLLPIKFIVLHHTVTRSAAQTARVLGARGFSTHFEVDREGSIVRYLDPAKYVAWASNWANARCIAIDITHMTGEPFPEVQIAAVAALVDELCATYGIAQKSAPLGAMYADRKQVPVGIGLLRHSNVHATECPNGFPIERCNA